MKKFVLMAAALLLAASPAAAAPVFWATNGHYYELVGTAATWDEARTAAAGRTHAGMTGYLATVTSAAEHAFIVTNVTQSLAWLGGTDRAVEGVWRWATGPESGQIFHGPGAPAGAFSKWAWGEPNDWAGGEDELTMNWQPGGFWNDAGTPSSSATRVPFVVEYGGLDEVGDVAEPTTLLLGGLGFAAVARRLRRRS